MMQKTFFTKNLEHTSKFAKILDLLTISDDKLGFHISKTIYDANRQQQKSPNGLKTSYTQ